MRQGLRGRRRQPDSELSYLAVVTQPTDAPVSDLPAPQVVKVAWSENLQKMRIDFRLFKQCRQVLVALKLEGHVDAQLVERMMHLVVLSEESTIAEFDMLREARVMEVAPAMLGDTWRDSWMDWANRLDLTAFPQLTSMQRQGEARPGMLDELMRCHGPHVRAPTGEWMSQHTPGQRGSKGLTGPRQTWNLRT